MDLGAETARPFRAAGGDGEVSAWAAATVVLAAEMGRALPVDPVIWGDEERMKRELVAWAKAVASMAAAGKNASPSTSPSSPWPAVHETQGIVLARAVL
ncbi:hypothetical protein C2845_PM09G08900 [Panicum miliaceum]|uniref:Uncharacterized protein n=1 Tax=Panicum miliaceum TaxID=4540 RepID=A0A3L6RYF2_PANMI|nr:hypothetical protein C2845_PM09G08900 [Panicum miliaceum]